MGYELAREKKKKFLHLLSRKMTSFSNKLQNEKIFKNVCRICIAILVVKKYKKQWKKVFFFHPRL